VVSDERRIAHDEGALVGWEDIVPVCLEGVGVVDFGGFFEWESEDGLAEGFAGEGVHLVVDEPHGDFCDSCGPFFDFDAVHLVYIDFEELVEVEELLDFAFLFGVVFFEYFDF